MSKGNMHKKATFEDRFARKYWASWFNHRKTWSWWKRYNRKKFRRIMKEEEEP